jgi:hypothetical protein
MDREDPVLVSADAGDDPEVKAEVVAAGGQELSQALLEVGSGLRRRVVEARQEDVGGGQGDRVLAAAA